MERDVIAGGKYIQYDKMNTIRFTLNPTKDMLDQGITIIQVKQRPIKPGHMLIIQPNLTLEFKDVFKDVEGDIL